MIRILLRLLGKRMVWLAVIVLAVTPALAADEAEGTRTLVIHHIRAMVQIPADWQYTTIDYGVYTDGESGYLQWSHVPGEASATIEDACQSVIDSPAFMDSNSTLEYIEVKGQAACTITPTREGDAREVIGLVVQHPYPFSTPATGLIEFVVYWTDVEHFEAITESLDFQPEHVRPENYMAAVLDFAAAQSYYRDEVNWESLRAFILEAVADDTDLSGIPSRINALVSVLRNVGDTHTIYFSPQTMEQMQSITPDDNIIQFPSGKRLTDTTAYLELQGLLANTEMMQRYAQTAHDVIRELDQEPVACWIVDLRRNGGGYLSPILEAVTPLLEAGVILQFVGGSSKDIQVELDGHLMNWNGQPIAQPFVEHPYQLRQPNPPTAVLIGPQTGSAGENTAIAFIGQPRTRSFGQHSGRLTIGNNGLILFDGGSLAVAANVSADRNGNQYPDGIEPDEVVEADSSAPDSPDHPVMAAALRWLKEEHGC